jgi:hypothetical protein
MKAMEAQAVQGRLSAQTHLATGFAEAQAGQGPDVDLLLASLAFVQGVWLSPLPDLQG